MNRKHLKRYWILISPFLLIALLLSIYLPQEFKKYSILVLIVFWIFYYGWIYNENNNKKKDQ